MYVMLTKIETIPFSEFLAGRTHKKKQSPSLNHTIFGFGLFVTPKSVFTLDPLTKLIFIAVGSVGVVSIGSSLLENYLASKNYIAAARSVPIITHIVLGSFFIISTFWIFVNA
jgi:hypothetical protein